MLRSVAVAVVLLITLASTVSARTITDMSGRRVSIPDRINRAVALSPPATYLLFCIAPELVCGINFPLPGNEKFYTVERFKKLPVIGGMVGEGRTLNLEVLLKVKPDVAFLWDRRVGGTAAFNEQYIRSLSKLGIPTVAVRLDTLEDYPAALLFMGDVLGRRERAARLNRYAVTATAKVKRSLAGLPESKRVRVYYAEGVDGLATEGESSMHTELIPLSGGRNVCRMKPTSLNGQERISMEQLLLYDPDVILVKEQICFQRIWKDPRWKRLRAVRNKRVYLVPHVPFNWFDRPPSYMRLLGIQWLTNLLHPDRYPMDMVRETKAFYRLFVGLELSDREAREVLWPR
ncbi:ABC transporter substrate-binding protein [Pelobacter propionicus]|uniref:Periplasmic binding protein n=1 Tax=Pelobacter propionicus (strain DSM 2379 / NBRC 103807 / OttBd1) TaxID=338966 RepID=A1AP23_PELPD|nr:ABC transporter substrate-binding protein [Pelobacter propionicus]ABK99093.1 periplasmic binding protein [Pelobacter propionicus DSM 2379]